MNNCENTTNKVSYDPGWNDPPSFAYNASQTTTPNRPRNFLNKRVAFPLSGNSNNAVLSPSVNLPPLPTTTCTSIKNDLYDDNKSQNETQINSESLLLEVREILLDFLGSSSELGTKADSIKKKIGLMEEMWLSGKLNKQIQLQMRDLAYALRDDNPSKSNEIHKALMVDHVSLVSTWMPGVKQLIYHCIARSELLAIDKE